MGVQVIAFPSTPPTSKHCDEALRVAEPACIKVSPNRYGLSATASDRPSSLHEVAGGAENAARVVPWLWVDVGRCETSLNEEIIHMHIYAYIYIYMCVYIYIYNVRIRGVCGFRVGLRAVEGW